MNARLPRAATHGVRVGLRLKIGAVAAALSALLVIAMLAIAWQGAQSQSSALAEQLLHHELDEVAHHIVHDLEASWQTLDQLAKQPLVSNALLDSEGREMYLHSFLERVDLPLGSTTRIILTDFQGRAVASSGTTGDLAAEHWLNRVVNSGRSYVGVTQRADREVLTLAAPVNYAATGTTEGALLLEADVEHWLGTVNHELADHTPLSRIAVKLQRRTVTLGLGDSGVSPFHASHEVTLDSPLDALAAEVSAWMPRNIHAAQMDRLWNRFWLLGLLGCTAAVLASQWLAHLVATRVEALARAANRTDGAHPDPSSLARLALGGDEVAAVAGVLCRQFERLSDNQRQLEEKVAESTRHLHRAQQVARTGSWTYQLDTARFDCTLEAASILSLPALTAIHPFTIFRRIHASDRPAVRAAWRTCADLGHCSIEFRVNAGRGSHWVSVSAERDDEAPRVGERIVGTLQDITARKRAELEMRRALAVFTHSAQGIMVTSANGQILAVNPAFSRITGYGMAEACGRTPALLRSGRQGRNFYREMWRQLTENGFWEGEIWNRRKTGEHYPQWLTITAIREVKGQFGDYVALFSDITERKQREEEAWRRANFDGLTGLANLQLFRDRLGAALADPAARTEGALVLCIDLHGLSEINAQLGHDAGDALLIEAANRLQASLSERDTLARRSGHEFLVMRTPCRAATDAEEICSGVLAAFHRPFALAGGRRELGVHVGAALYPRDADSPAELLRHAELALLTVHQNPKLRSRLYSRDMEAGELERRQLELDLHEAIAFGDFSLRYQPVVDARSGLIVSAEALIRWQHPREGLLAPADFITVAERSGLLAELALWSIPRVLSDAAQLGERAASALALSINLRGLELERAQLLATLATALEGSGLDASRLTLEIPEAMLSANFERATQLMASLGEAGFGLAIDDFGDQLASLNHLQSLPVRELKIERQIVAGCLHSEASARSIAAIISMAATLDITVTAKGVENYAQAEHLRRAGCHRLQGHFLSPALTAGELAANLGEALYQPFEEGSDFSV